MKILSLVAALGLVGFMLPAMAQQTTPPIVIDKVDAALVDLPIYNAVFNPPPGAAARPSKWLQVEFTFECNTQDQILPEAEFRVYIEVQDLVSPLDKEGPPAVLTGETTYVSLPNSRDLHGVFYVHPYTIHRFGGETAFSFSGKKNIRVEAVVDGQDIGFRDVHPDDPNWIGSMKKIAGFVMTKEMSPWALLNIDRYPPVKERSLNP